MLFATEHVLMCIPVWILSYNISRRNLVIHENFKIHPAEELSTTVAYTMSVVGPIFFTLTAIFQYRLFEKTQKMSQIWSVVNRPYDGEKVVKEIKIHLQPLTSAEDLVESYFVCFWSNVVSYSAIELFP